MIRTYEVSMNTPLAPKKLKNLNKKNEVKNKDLFYNMERLEKLFLHKDIHLFVGPPKIVSVIFGSYLTINIPHISVLLMSNEILRWRN